MTDQPDLDIATVEEFAKDAILDIDPEKVKSPVLQRLIRDIQDDTPASNAYNRMHNRHNRGR